MPSAKNPPAQRKAPAKKKGGQPKTKVASQSQPIPAPDKKPGKQREKLVLTGMYKGNMWWKHRQKHGRDKKYTPEELWGAACEYFQWCEDNPLWETKVVQFQGAGYDHPVAKIRMPLVGQMCVYIGITHQTWINYKKDPDYFEICDAIEAIINGTSLQGAAADLLNANIVARLLGLRDQTSTEVTGKDGGPIEQNMSVSEISPDDDFKTAVRKFRDFMGTAMLLPETKPE